MAAGPGSVTLGGRRVPVTRPRVRSTDGSGEVAVPAYELFTGTELLGRLALEKMLAGVSTRRYPAALEPVGEAVQQSSRATSRSAVSRRFVAMTETALADLLAKDLTDLDLVALMVDGVHFADLGIDIDGTKHPLGLVEGSTENTTVVRGLLAGLRDRGPGRHPPGPGRAGRRHGPGRRRQGGVRQAGDRPVSAAQAEERA
jgi:hypothetical protein